MMIRAITTVLSTQFLKIFLSLGIQILIARFLLPEGRGIYGLAISIAAIFLLITFFGNEYGIRYFLVHKKMTYTQAFIYLIFCICVSAIASFIIIWSINLHRIGLKTSVTNVILTLACGVSITQLLITQTNVFLTIRGDFKAASLYSIGEEFLKLAAIATFMSWSPTVEGALLATIVGNLCVFVLYVVGCRFLYNEGREFKLSDLGLIYNYGIHSFWLNFSNLSITNLGTLILSGLLPAGKIGLYNLAFGLIARVQVLPDALNRVLVPASVATQDNSRRQKIACITLTGLAVFCVSATVVFGFLNKTIMGILFGKSYVDAGPIAFILLMGFSFKVIGKPLEAHFNEISGNPKLFSLIQISNVFMMAAFTYIGGLLYGLSGAAVGSAIAMIAGSFILFFIYSNSTHQKLRELLSIRDFIGVLKNVFLRKLQ